MNWYDTYLLAKKKAVNHQIIVKRMQVQLEQAQAQKLGGDSALTETEEKVLKAVRSEKPIDYLQGAKGPGGAVTNSEKKILTDLAQRGFMDEVINLMVTIRNQSKLRLMLRKKQMCRAGVILIMTTRPARLIKPNWTKLDVVLWLN